MQLMMMIQAAGQAAAVAIHAGAANATDNVPATLGAAIVLPFVLQAMKNAAWFPWLTRQTSRINFTVGVVAAAAATLGIHANYDVVTGGTITIPGVHVLWQAVIQWAGQQAAYKGLVVPAETLGDIRGLLQQLLSALPASTKGNDHA